MLAPCLPSSRTHIGGVLPGQPAFQLLAVGRLVRFGFTLGISVLFGGLMEFVQIFVRRMIVLGASLPPSFLLSSLLKVV